MKNTVTRSKVLSFLAGWIKPAVTLLIVVAFIFISGFRLVKVEGCSMDSTLENGEQVVITNFMYKPQTGDIVVISKGAHYDTPIIKRVIAVGGQTLRLDYANDKIYVDGQELNEPYLHCSTFAGRYGNYAIPSVIPEGKLFVMGDNRAVSCDSRDSTIGLVDVNDVLGKAQFAVFPFDRLGAVDTDKTA